MVKVKGDIPIVYGEMDLWYAAESAIQFHPPFYFAASYFAVQGYLLLLLRGEFMR